jgi:hypothetical protein
VTPDRSHCSILTLLRLAPVGTCGDSGGFM